ncbi:MAG: CDGSH iron-sulfur domain-containing protein [Solirubrobacteraceae bacterium]|jgi:CDGSH-type Zn-finger protein
MSDEDAPRITITENGPYLVSGALPLKEQSLGLDASGNTWDYEDVNDVEAGESYALCRCGQSASKPFCDGAHARVGFQGAETASRRPFHDDAELIEGPTMELADNRRLCAFARICDGHGRIWNTVLTAEDETSRELVAHQATHCPSGRLLVSDKPGGDAYELPFEPSIVLIEDPQENASGPIWVRGGVTVLAADGTEYESRNRVTLCRCGQSANKPFCDGTHAHVGFRAHPDAD